MWRAIPWMAGAAALAAALLPARAAAPAGQRVPVYVNGGRLEGDALLLPNVGRTLLPMRTLFESLGARVEWDPAQRAVYAWKPDGAGVRLGLGERVAQRLRMDPEPAPGRWGRVVGTQSLEVPPMLIGGRVYVPLRFASEALDAEVRYAAARPAVFIQTEAVAGFRQEEPTPARVAPAEEPLEALLARAVEVELVIEGERFERGEEIPMQVVVRNRSNRPITIPFDTGQQFDVEVLQEDRLVWNWAHQRLFTQALTRLTLPPGGEEVFTLRWDGRNHRGRLAPAGRYLVRARLTTPYRLPNLVAEERITLRD